jgi:hypothetical protein
VLKDRNPSDYDDQANDVGTFLVAQSLYVLERTEPVDHRIEMGEVIVFTCIVVDKLAVHEAQCCQGRYSSTFDWFPRS